jgi:hypothetical protein
LIILLGSTLSKALIYTTSAICKGTIDDTALSSGLLHARTNIAIYEAILSAK